MLEQNNFLNNEDLNIKECAKLKAHDVIKILDDMRSLPAISEKQFDETILISIKIPKSLLGEFKAKCSQEGLKYQTQIKSLMKAWLKG